MFFKDFDFNVNIISAFELSWEKVNELSDIRPFDALSIRLQGGADFIVNDKKLHVKKNDIVYVPAYLRYTLKTELKEHLYVIHFISNGKPKKEIEIFTPKNASVFTDLFQKIHTKYTNKLPGYNFSALSSFYKIIEQMCIQTNERMTTLKSFNYAIEYIHTNYTNEDITVKQLAEISHVSETYFRNLFLKRMNTTPLKYINELRLSLADELLASKYYSISEVAQLCGFTDPKYFTTVYKKHRGISPSKIT